ncbi:hypothetical protein [Nocardia brasiliensis]|uniref:hypothetical protein n=1 Tax=Nocardia brasiliensis TaxID=37326 RepID=UPI002454438D|nr:hypothetical protein [Nocardia brasiliensis]
MNDKTTENQAVAPSTTDRAFRLRQIGWALTVVALFTAGAAAWFVAASTPRFYRVDVVPTWVSIMSLPLCWTLGWGLYSNFALKLFPCKQWLRLTIGAALVLVALISWPISIALSSAAPSRFGTDKAVEVSPDGRYELVTQSFSDGFEPCCRVLLRERDGLFSRQTLVWERIEGNCPVRAYFPDNNTIGITEWKGGAPMTTAFDQDRLEVAQTLPPKAR